MSAEQKSLKQIINFRKEKLNDLQKKGVNPYPSNFTPTHFSESIKINFEKLQGEDVIVAGRIMAVRRMGKASFFRIIDNKGAIQVFIKKDDIGENSYENFKLFDIGDFVGVGGQVFKTKTGEISIRTSELTLLAKSIRPLPIVKEKDGIKYDSFSDKEQRYRNRHLDLLLNKKVKNTFIKRTKIIQCIRTFLDEHKFLEVETPVLQPIYGGANARPFITHHNTLDQKLYMRIADELYLKRLIIGGLDRVYEIGKDFRNEGMDRNHNPEFTMLEFYWAYADYEDCMKLVENLIRNIAKKIDALEVSFNNIEINLSKPFKKKTFSELLSNKLEVNVNDLSESKLKQICKEKEIQVKPDANIGQILDALMGELVEPTLTEPTFVIDYPKVISPLAKMHRSGDPKLVERFELFIGGDEFANSFSELNDPIDQRKRLEEQASFKKLGDEEAQNLDENFIQAMECGMPPTGGVGIGIDRLVMLLTESSSIKDVILFPALRSEVD
ncbi:MAG: lysine--tRNA ligase [Candidatus Marinimicrobia bacterium]|nr:lysine--tRNA ligase [Candidatus Neomarinimicrobiota bacterium]